MEVEKKAAVEPAEAVVRTRRAAAAPAVHSQRATATAVKIRRPSDEVLGLTTMADIEDESEYNMVDQINRRL